MRLSQVKIGRGAIDRRDETKIMALSIYCASMYGGATPLQVDECVRRARDLSGAVDKSFEAEVQAEQEQRMAERAERMKKEDEFAKARKNIFGEVDGSEEEW